MLPQAVLMTGRAERTRDISDAKGLLREAPIYPLLVSTAVSRLWSLIPSESRLLCPLRVRVLYESPFKASSFPVLSGNEMNLHDSPAAVKWDHGGVIKY